MNELSKLHTVGIAGAGTMGQGIAHLALQAAQKVILYDLNKQSLTKAHSLITKTLTGAAEKGIFKGNLEHALSNLTLTDDVNQLEAPFIIEAIVERLEIKRDLFMHLEKVNTSESIFATNTSSIPVTQLAAGINNPSRVVGMHFFNPAHIMKLVEVISGVATDNKVAELTIQLAKHWGKVPVKAKDSPGFIVNRVARPYYVEALKQVEEGVADFQTIDRILESKGFRMGPFRLMDLIGVDTNFSVTSTMYEQFFYEPRFRPSRIQQQKVMAGHHGRKTNRGFYHYDE